MLSDKKRKERKKNLYVLTSMVKQNVRFKYRNSFLGVLWTVLRPILEMLVLWFIFGQFFGNGDPTYHLYLLSASIAFNVLSEATLTSLKSIANSTGLLNSTKLSYEVIPLAKTLSSLVNFLFSAVALILIMLFTMIFVPGYYVNWTIIFVIVWLPCLVVFSYGVSLLLAALYVFFRDIEHIYGVFMVLWRYLTPLFYKTDSFPNAVVMIININPMTQYVDFFRTIIGQNGLPGTVPALSQFLFIFGWAIAMYALGALVFKSLKRKFILYL